MWGRGREKEGGVGVGVRLQLGMVAGQRLCLKGATWVGTVTAPNGNKVQAGTKVTQGMLQGPECVT